MTTKESAPVGKLDRDYTRQRIKEWIDEGDGFWRACSGCQEGEDGYVSENDYPFDPMFRCQPGGGCSECGGIGVLWDDGRGYDDIAADEEPAALAQPRAAMGDGEGLIRKALESMMRATTDDATPIIRRLARVQTREALRALALQSPPAAKVDREAIARVVIGPRNAVPDGSPYTLRHLQDVRWGMATSSERKEALWIADAILALQPVAQGDDDDA